MSSIPGAPTMGEERSSWYAGESTHLSEDGRDDTVNLLGRSGDVRELCPSDAVCLRRLDVCVEPSKPSYQRRQPYRKDNATDLPSPRVWWRSGLVLTCVVFGLPAMCRIGTCSEKAPAWERHHQFDVRILWACTNMSVHR
jgi:hypothetical protein